MAPTSTTTPSTHRPRNTPPVDPSEANIQLRPLRSATIAINGATQTFPPEIPDAESKILTNLGFNPGY